MHLAELLTLGARPGAGLLVALTGRCPLSCSHCSTDSSMSSPQFPEAPFRRLVDSFDPDDHPGVMLLSGGEPLLRTSLVRDLARRARPAGTRTALISGMFFARGGGGVPPAVLEAVSQLDHFAASVDAPHEREVGRHEVFAALSTVLDHVPGASLHVTGTPGCGDGPDPYVEQLVADVRRRFGDRLPMLVGSVQPTGRAAAADLGPGTSPGTGSHRAEDNADATRPSAPGPSPCQFVAWPMVDLDGTVYACTRQSLVRTARPRHLVLGHASRDSWQTLRERTLADPLLRSIRTLGPLLTGHRFADGADSGPDRVQEQPPATGTAAGCAADACHACQSLSTGGTAARAAAYLDSPGGLRTEAAIENLLTQRSPRLLATARGASARYAHLTELGRSGETCRTS